jgi:dihydrofolate reductase
VIRSFPSGHLTDDLTVSIVPALLGDGIRLFDDSVAPRACH